MKFLREMGISPKPTAFLQTTEYGAVHLLLL